MNLTELREKQSLTIEEVASRLGTDSSTIESWESGEKLPTRNPEQMIELLTLYDVTLEELIDAAAKSSGGD